MLEKKAGKPLQVEIVFEGYRLLNLEQKKQLNIKGLGLNKPVIGWFREVLLYGNAIEPWIFAQSIFPIHSLKGNAKRLKNLNNTPIGYVLFKRQKQVDNTRLICRINNNWKRQSLYKWRGRNIMISETFLESFK